MAPLTNDLFVLHPIGVIHDSTGNAKGIRAFRIHITYDPTVGVATQNKETLLASELAKKPILLSAVIRRLKVTSILSVETVTFTLEEAQKYGIVIKKRNGVLQYWGSKYGIIHITQDERFINNRGVQIEHYYVVIRDVFNAFPKYKYRVDDVDMPAIYIIDKTGAFVPITAGKVKGIRKTQLIYKQISSMDKDNTQIISTLNDTEALRKPVLNIITMPLGKCTCDTAEPVVFDGLLQGNTAYKMPINSAVAYGDAQKRKETDLMRTTVDLLTDNSIKLERSSVFIAGNLPHVENQLEACVNIIPDGRITSIPAGTDVVTLFTNDTEGQIVRRHILRIPSSVWFVTTGSGWYNAYKRDSFGIKLDAPLSAYRFFLADETTSHWLLPLAARDSRNMGTCLCLNISNPTYEGVLLDITKNVKDLYYCSVNFSEAAPADKIVMPLSIGGSQFTMRISDKQEKPFAVTFAPVPFEKVKAPKTYSAHTIYSIEDTTQGFSVLSDFTNVKGTATVEVSPCSNVLEPTKGNRKLVIKTAGTKNINLDASVDVLIDINGTGKSINTLRVDAGIADVLGRIIHNKQLRPLDSESIRRYNTPSAINVNLPVTTLQLDYKPASQEYNKVSLATAPYCIRHIYCRKGVKQLLLHAPMRWESWLSQNGGTKLRYGINTEGIINSMMKRQFAGPIIVHIPKGTKAQVIRDTIAATVKFLETKDSRDNYYSGVKGYMFAWTGSPEALKAFTAYLQSLLIDDLPEI